MGFQTRHSFLHCATKEQSPSVCWVLCYIRKNKREVDPSLNGGKQRCVWKFQRSYSSEMLTHNIHLSFLQEHKGRITSTYRLGAEKPRLLEDPWKISSLFLKELLTVLLPKQRQVAAICRQRDTRELCHCECHTPNSRWTCVTPQQTFFLDTCNGYYLAEYGAWSEPWDGTTFSFPQAERSVSFTWANPHSHYDLLPSPGLKWWVKDT